jgi:ABC-type transport system substrate-binding protein
VIRRFAVIAGLLSVMGGTACTRPPSAQATRRTIIIGTQFPLVNFSLARSSSADYAELTSLVFDGLTEVDDDGVIHPALAKHWEISPDRTTYTFTLRAARFHDGTPLRAADVQRSWEKMLQSRPGWHEHPWMLDEVEGALSYSEGHASTISGLEVLSDSVLRVRLLRPYAPFPALLSLPKVAIVGATSDSLHPIGTGVWRWVSGPSPAPALEIVLARNPDPWGEGVRMDSLIVHPVEPGETVGAFTSGQLDWMEGVDNADYITLAARRDVGLQRSAPLGISRLIIECGPSGIPDVRVRRAIAAAVDVPRLIQAIDIDTAQLAHGVIPRGWLGYDPTRRPMPYDPALARRLLREANYPMARPLRIWSSEVTYAGKPRIGPMIRDYLEAVGFTVQLHDSRVQDSTNIAMEKRDADITFEAWYPDYADSDAMLFPLYHSSVSGSAGNDGHYADPEMDRLIDAARAESDAAKRAVLLRAADARGQSEVADVLLWHQPSMAVFSPRFRGWQSTNFVTRFRHVEPATAGR